MAGRIGVGVGKDKASRYKVMYASIRTGLERMGNCHRTLLLLRTFGGLAACCFLCLAHCDGCDVILGCWSGWAVFPWVSESADEILSENETSLVSVQRATK